MILPYVGISGSGLFAVYLLGVLDTLISNHSIVPGHTVLAGSSGGGMLALHTCLGLHPRHTFVHFNAALQQCAATPHSCALSNLTNMGGRVMQAMISHLNDDQAWKKCVNKAHVHMSLVHNAPHDAAHADCPLQLRKLGWSISNWTSNEDVIHAAGATSYIPGIMGSHCATTFRGQPVIDGGYHDHLPCPPGAEGTCVRINAFPLEESHLEEFNGVDALPFPPKDTKIDIYPGMRGAHTLPPIPVGTWSTKMIMDVQGIAPHAEALFALGQDDAAAWLQQQGPAEECPAAAAA